MAGRGGCRREGGMCADEGEGRSDDEEEEAQGQGGDQGRRSERPHRPDKLCISYCFENSNHEEVL